LSIITKPLLKLLITPMKTRFTSHVFLFQQILEYQDAISNCYEQQQALHLTSKVSIDQTWVVTQTICDPLLPMVKQCGFESWKFKAFGCCCIH